MDKCEFKAAVIGELGAKIEDMAEAATLDVSRNEGAKEALLLAAKKLGELQEHVDKDMDEGLLSDCGEVLVAAKHIKRYITRAVSILESGAASAENHRLLAQGRYQALSTVVTNMSKTRDAEIAKAKQRQAVEEGLPIGRVLGVHPGMSLKERRNAESELPDSEVTPEPVVEPTPQVIPAKRGKRAKNT